MASDNSTVHTLVRNFVNCRILWRIENFSLAICKPGIIVSEEFIVSGTKVTKWAIGLSLESENYDLRLSLHRGSDNLNETMKVIWKVTIFDRKGEGSFIAEKESNLTQKSSSSVVVTTPFDILRVLSADEPNEVRIVYDMIVYLNTPMIIPTPVNDAAQQDLFSDLEKICESSDFSDITAKLNGESLKLHKAMLCPRSVKLTRDAGSGRKVFQLYYSDVRTIKNLLSYLYTGNLKYIFDPPSISMTDYVRDLDIKELHNCYSQENITLETVVKANQFEFCWTIPDFHNCHEQRDSEVYNAAGISTSWKLRIYPKGKPEDTDKRIKYIYIEALVVNCNVAQNVFVDFKAINKDRRTVVAKRVHGAVNRGNKLGVYFMRINSYATLKALENNTLDLRFVVSEATGIIDSRITEIQAPVPFNLTNYDTFKILINYLGLLQTKNEYSDMTLNIDNHEFKCHKFFLAARSKVFSNMLKDRSEDNPCLSLNYIINKHEFRVFLDFLYTGNVTNVDMNVQMRMYDLADKFLVESLKTACLKELDNHLSPMNTCRLLAFSDLRHIATLKTEALQFLFQFRDEIFNTEDWGALVINYPRIAYDVQIFVNSNLRRLAEEGLQQIPEVREETEAQGIVNTNEFSTAPDQRQEGSPAVDTIILRPEDSSEH